MPAKKKETIDVPESIVKATDEASTFNPLLVSLQENDKKNLFKTNVTTAYHKTGYPQFDHFFGSVINVHDDLGKIIAQKPRLGQAAGTFNMFVGASQSGKEQPDSTPIPTPDGWKFLSDIEPGDYVYTHNFKKTEVLGVYYQGVKEVYRIRFEDGRTAECGLNHLWNATVLDNNNNHLAAPRMVDTFSMHQIIELYNDGCKVLIPVYDWQDSFRDINLDYLNLKGFSLTWNRIIDISVDRQEECRCIYVEDESHMYITDQFVLTHNTTLSVQIAANIIRQYKDSNVIHFDCEERFDITRAENITKLPSDYFKSNRYMIRTGAVGLDVIQEMIVKTYVHKMKLKDQLMVDSGMTDEFNQPVMIFEPTVVIIDSITTVLSETFNPDNNKEATDAEKMRSNTEGARDAKTLKGFFKDILPICKEANIIVYAINHININMSMNAFVPVAKQQNYLKQDESIPGGKTMLYYPFNIIKLTAKTSDSFDDETDGFTGHIVMVEPLKSSSNQSGNNSKGISFEMVFSQKYGFDSLRSLILYGRAHGQLDGNRNRLKFKGDDSFTFSWKDLDKEKLEKPIWENVKKFIIPDLDQYLPYTQIDNTEFDKNVLDY